MWVSFSRVRCACTGTRRRDRQLGWDPTLPNNPVDLAHAFSNALCPGTQPTFVTSVPIACRPRLSSVSRCSAAPTTRHRGRRPRSPAPAPRGSGSRCSYCSDDAGLMLPLGIVQILICIMLHDHSLRPAFASRPGRQSSRWSKQACGFFRKGLESTLLRCPRRRDPDRTTGRT